MTGKTKLTTDQVEERFELAALTLKRTPNPTGSGPKGFGSSWPDYVRSRFTAYGTEAARVRVIPSPKEIQMMEDTIGWLMLLKSDDEEKDSVDRRIVWMRAERQPWRYICSHVGLSRAQANRRWAAALITITKRLEKPKTPARSRGGRAERGGE